MDSAADMPIAEGGPRDALFFAHSVKEPGLWQRLPASGLHAGQVKRRRPAPAAGLQEKGDDVGEGGAGITVPQTDQCCSLIVSGTSGYGSSGLRGTPVPLIPVPRFCFRPAWDACGNTDCAL